MLGKREGAGITIFRQNCFVSLPKNFVGEPFGVSENFWYRKSFWIRGGEYQDFPSKIFCLTVPKNFVVETFCAVFQKISGSEKVYG